MVFKSQTWREKDHNHNKFQATTENLNGKNGKVSSNKYKSLKFKIDFFGSFVFSFYLLSCWERKKDFSVCVLGDWVVRSNQNSHTEIELSRA